MIEKEHKKFQKFQKKNFKFFFKIFFFIYFWHQIQWPYLMRIDNPYLVAKIFENISPDSVRFGRTCPANLAVRSCPVRKLICPVWLSPRFVKIGKKHSPEKILPKLIYVHCAAGRRAAQTRLWSLNAQFQIGWSLAKMMLIASEHEEKLAML